MREVRSQREEHERVVARLKREHADQFGAEKARNEEEISKLIEQIDQLT